MTTVSKGSNSGVPKILSKGYTKDFELKKSVLEDIVLQNPLVLKVNLSHLSSKNIRLKLQPMHTSFSFRKIIGAQSEVYEGMTLSSYLPS
jgi:hypothetical protein